MIRLLVQGEGLPTTTFADDVWRGVASDASGRLIVSEGAGEEQDQALIAVPGVGAVALFAASGAANLRRVLANMIIGNPSAAFITLQVRAGGLDVLRVTVPPQGSVPLKGFWSLGENLASDVVLATGLPGAPIDVMARSFIEPV